MEDKEKNLVQVGIVPYQLKGMQGGIQFKHSSDEYPIKYGFDDSLFLDWIHNHKTVWVLDGGTTNNNNESKYYGTLNKLRDKLEFFGIRYSEFYEPDLGDQLLGITLICDANIRRRDYLPKGEFVITDNMEILRFNSMLGDINESHEDFYKIDDSDNLNGYEYSRESIILHTLIGHLRFAS